MPYGHSLVRSTTGIAERIVGAQPVAKERDETKIRQRLKNLAAYAGEDWFYRFPIKQPGGGTSYIEGPSIKLANNVAREFGNNVTEVRELDVGDAWVFYARFTDIETGFSMERAYRQRKGQTSIKTKDVDRQLDIVYQIGQSKAIRNVLTNALDFYCQYAFEEARNSLVDKIGKDLIGWREKTIKGFAKMAVAIERVERIIGRAAKDWTAPDLAQVIAMARSITDGMATADETFPPIEKVPAAAQSSETATAGGGEQAQSAPPTSDPSAAQQPEVSDSATADAPAAADVIDPIKEAYEAGKFAKMNGKRRADIPRDYRDGKHDQQAAAWLAGFDGKPMEGNQ
jgi:hypothetical protein